MNDPAKQMKNLGSQSAFFLGLFFFIAGHLLRPFATDPDVHFGVLQFTGTCFLFFWWWLGIYCSGKCLAYFLPFHEKPAFLALALGSAAAVFIVCAAGFLDFIHYEQSWFFSVLLFVFILLSGFLPHPEGPHLNFIRKFADSSKPERIAITLGAAIFGLVMMNRLLQSLLLHGYSDPIMYHLVGPRLWTDAGHIYFAPQHPFSYQASYWEYLYVWGSILLGEQGGRGLLETQLFSQLAHVMVGSVGTALALFYFLNRTWNKPSWIWLALLAAFSSTDLASMSWLAKNDWGIFFWVVTGAAILVMPQQKLFMREILAGIFFGLALGTKPTAVLAVAALVGLALDFNRDKKYGKYAPLRQVLVIFFSTAVAALPVLIRNFKATANPFYPYVANVFPSNQLSAEMQAYFAQLAPTLIPDLHSQWKIWKDVMHDSALYYGLLLIPLAFVRGSQRKLLVLWTGSFFLCTIPFTVLKIQEGLLRWAGLGLVIGPILTVLSLSLIAQNLNHKWKNTILLVATLVVCGITFPFLISKNLSAVVNGPSPDEAIRSSIHIGGKAKAWLRLNLKEGEHAYSTGDNQLYYVLHLGVFSIPENPDFDQRIKILKTSNDFAQFIRQSKIKYFLDSQHFSQNAWGSFAGYVHERLKDHTQTIVFESPDSIIIDAEKLAESLPAL